MGVDKVKLKTRERVHSTLLNEYVTLLIISLEWGAFYILCSQLNAAKSAGDQNGKTVNCKRLTINVPKYNTMCMAMVQFIDNDKRANRTNERE